jgi:hypothetical protein
MKTTTKKMRKSYKGVSKWMRDNRHKKLWGAEFLLEHLSDESKNIRVIAKFRELDSIGKAVQFITSFPSSEYGDSFYHRPIYTPRTRKDKAIHRSKLSQRTHEI